MNNVIIDEMYAYKTRLGFRLQETNFQDKKARIKYDDLQKFLDNYEEMQLSEVDKKARDLRHNLNQFFNKLDSMIN